MCVSSSVCMKMHNGYEFTDASYDDINVFAPARLEHTGVFWVPVLFWRNTVGGDRFLSKLN